jgi:hypothetical protein
MMPTRRRRVMQPDTSSASPSASIPDAQCTVAAATGESKRRYPMQSRAAAVDTDRPVALGFADRVIAQILSQLAARESIVLRTLLEAFRAAA